MPSPSSASVSRSIGSCRRGVLALLAVLISAVAIGAVNLAALHTMAARLDSYASAALVVGAFSLGNALGLIVQGRLIDRFSPTRVAYVAAALFCVAVVTVVIWHSSAQLVYIGLFLVAGLSLPAVTGIARAAVPSLYPKHLHLRLYSAIAVTFQAGMACGPLVASMFYPARASGYAFLVIAGLVVVATICVAGLRSSDKPVAAIIAEGESSQAAGATSSSTGLMTGGYITVLLATLGFGISTGVVTVGLPAVLDVLDPKLAGIAFTALALGDLVSGVVYGSRRWPGTLPRHLLLSLFCAGLAASLLASLSNWVLLAIGLMFLLGAMGTPAGIVMSALLDTTVHSSRLTAAFTTMVATNLVAVSIGSAAGSSAIELAGAQSALVIAPLALLCTAGIVTIRRRSIRAEESASDCTDTEKAGPRLP